MNNFVISVKSSHARREHIDTEFRKFNLDFKFFDAITADQVQETAKQLNLDTKNSTLKSGEMGCLLSHVSLWHYAVEKNLPYISIFEDDIYLGENADQYLKDYEWIDPQWDILKIEKNAKKNYFSLKKRTHLSDRRLVGRLLDSNFGTAGYILSLAGAKKLLDYVQKIPTLDHIDQIMFRHYLHQNDLPIYQMNPALCIQEYLLFPNQNKLATTLTWRENTPKPKLSFVEKIQRELMRLLRQLYFLPNAVKMTFK